MYEQVEKPKEKNIRAVAKVVKHNHKSKKGKQYTAQMIRATQQVLGGQNIGTSANNPGNTMRWSNGYSFHIHANNYGNENLQSLTITVWANNNPYNRSHLTITEQNGQWATGYTNNAANVNTQAMEAVVRGAIIQVQAAQVIADQNGAQLNQGDICLNKLVKDAQGKK
ncbi:hypothetical protein ACODM8_04780 [Vibrio ostreicida]|uniref:hypothetical protein n=1 Tax=Vibrio ostreicida TaxID=526588 RepID=UPI003B5C2E31